MRMSRPVALSLAVASIAINTTARTAFAFGGSARELERQGTFAVTNNAGFGFSQQLNGTSGTSFTLRPALDYFVIPNLSVGGAVQFDSHSRVRAPSSTSFSFAPEVGYEFALSDTWSFWPQLALRMDFPSDGDPGLAIVLFAPFLIHPAEHFFFGIGPGFEQGITANPSTLITGGFLIGGYFDH